MQKELEPILRKADNGRFIHTKLTPYQPLPTWRSPLGRMMVIGDAAHPTPPAPAQSGSQAIEDGAVVAIALELAGKNDVPLALEAAEKIRCVSRLYMKTVTSSSPMDTAMIAVDCMLTSRSGILEPQSSRTRAGLYKITHLRSLSINQKGALSGCGITTARNMHIRSMVL